MPKRTTKAVTAEIVTVEQQDNEVIKLPAGVEMIPGLDIPFAKKILKGFEVFFEQAAMYESEAKQIIVTDATDVATISRARELRLTLQKIRTGAEREKDKNKADLLVHTRFIDGLFNTVKMVTMPLENHLMEQEKFAEIQLKKMREELREKRLAELAPYEVDTSYIVLEDMPEDSFNKLVADSKTNFENKQKAIEAQKKEQEEQDKKREQELADAKEQKRLAEIERKEQEKKQAELDARQAKIEKEEKRIADEKKAEDEKRIAQEKADQEKRDKAMQACRPRLGRVFPRF